MHGVTTNRDLLVRILRHPEFLAGDIDTGFLVRHDPAVLGAPLAGAVDADSSTPWRPPWPARRGAAPTAAGARGHALGLAQQPVRAPDASRSPGPTESAIDVATASTAPGRCTRRGRRRRRACRHRRCVVRARRRGPRRADASGGAGARRYDVEQVGPTVVRRRARRLDRLHRDRALPAAREPARRRRPGGPAAGDGREGGRGRRRRGARRRHPDRHRGHEDGARGAGPDRRHRDRGPRRAPASRSRRDACWWSSTGRPRTSRDAARPPGAAPGPAHRQLLGLLRGPAGRHHASCSRAVPSTS